MPHSINSKSVNEVILGISIGQQVQHWRKVKGYSQEQLAQKLGTQQPSISRIEKDNYLPSLSFLIKIVEVLGKNIEVKIK